MSLFAKEADLARSHIMRRFIFA